MNSKTMNSVLQFSIITCPLIGICFSYPVDSEYFIDGPEAIPLHSLSKFSLDVEIPSNEIQNLEDSSTWKHKRHHPTQLALESCCPSIVEIIEPAGGKNRSGDLVELYQTENVRQRFYEVSCNPSIAEQHCRYLDRRHTLNSRCNQQYSYTYALVRDFGVQPGNRGWRLDYIQIRSGCSCKISHSQIP